MARHVKILATLHIVFSALGLMATWLIGLLVFVGLGGLGVSAVHESGLLTGNVGRLIRLFVLALSLFGLIGGIGLLRFKPWARNLMIVISALDLLSFPFQTALGIYGLWVLLNRETKQLLSGTSVTAAAAPPTY